MQDHVIRSPCTACLRSREAWSVRTGLSPVATSTRFQIEKNERTFTCHARHALNAACLACIRVLSMAIIMDFWSSDNIWTNL